MATPPPAQPGYPSPQTSTTAELGTAGGKPKNWFARHKILTAFLALIVLGMATNNSKDAHSDAAALVADSAATQPAAQSPTEPASSAPATTLAKATTKAPAKPVASATAPKPQPKPVRPNGIGTAVRDGKFEFKVTKVKSGVASVGSEYLNKRAQGQFTLVYVTVRNIGEEPQTLIDSEQVVHDARGRRYSTDSTASIYIDGNDVFFNEINPGNTVSGVLVFDMPKGVKPASIEVHDSFWSDGSTIRLM